MKDSGTAQYIKKYLGSDEHPMSLEEARASLFSLRDETYAGNVYMGAATAVIFRYRLLDIAAEVMGCPRHEGVTLVDRGPRPSCTNIRISRVSNLLLSVFLLLHVIQMYDALQNWPEVIVKFRNIYQSGLRNSFAPTLSFPTTVNKDQHIFQVGLQSLSRAFEYQTGTHYYKVMYNIEVLVFCLWWFGMVRICSLGGYCIYFIDHGSQGFMDFPKDHHSLVDVLSQ